MAGQLTSKRTKATAFRSDRDFEIRSSAIPFRTRPMEGAAVLLDFNRPLQECRRQNRGCNACCPTLLFHSCTFYAVSPPSGRTGD